MSGSRKSRFQAVLVAILAGLTILVMIAFVNEYVQRESRRKAGSWRHPETPRANYTVKKGDTLYSISKRYLGSGGRFREILEVNPELRAKSLQVGMKIRIPTSQPAESFINTLRESY